MALFGVHGLVRPKKCLTPPTLLERRYFVNPLAESKPRPNGDEGTKMIYPIADEPLWSQLEHSAVAECAA